MSDKLKKIGSYIKKHPYETAAIIAIIIFASYIRLYHIRDYQVFLGDQGRDVLTVKHMIERHRPTFIGPTASVGGFFLGPFYYYLMVIPLLLSWFDPVGPAIMVAILSIVTTYMCYLYGKRYFSVNTGLIAAAVYSISRLVVEYARSSWNPNVLPFFSFLLVFMFSLLLEKNIKHKKIILLVIGACMGIIIQLHYAVWGMYIFTGLVYLTYQAKNTVRHGAIKLWQMLREIGLMLLGFLLFFMPFLGFEIYHGFPNFSNIIRFVFTNRGGGFSGGYTYEFIIRDTVYRLFLRLVGGGNDTIAQIALFIVAVGALYSAYLFFSRFYIYIRSEKDPSSFLEDLRDYICSVLDNRKGIGFFILLVWFICGIVLWGFYKKSIFDYYYSYMYVLPVMLFAAYTDLIIQLKSRRLKIRSNYSAIKAVLTTGAICFIVAVLAVNYKSVSTIFPGMQVYRAEEVAKAVIIHKAPGLYNFALITPGNSDHAIRYFLELYGYTPTPLETEVTGQLMIFCEQEIIDGKACAPEGNPLWEVAGFGPASVVGQWQVIGLPMYRMEHIESSKHLEGKPVKKG